MGRKSVPVKTKEGTEEIRARGLGLAPRIRTALLLVDGVKSIAELERLMEAAGVTPGALQLLIDKGLIKLPDEPPEEEAPVTLHDAAHTVLAAPEAGRTALDIPPTILEIPTRIEPQYKPQKELHEEPSRPAQAAVVRETEKSKPPAPRILAAPLEVVTLLELETILEGATKMEVATILGVATMLELTPTQMMAPPTAVKAPKPSEPARLPPLAQAEQEHQSAFSEPKPVIPAAVLRMNLMAARAHLAAALDQFLEIDGYMVKQKVMACETREELEHLIPQIAAALIKKIEKTAAKRLLSTAEAMLDR
jgi:hypothetical protein